MRLDEAVGSWRGWEGDETAVTADEQAEIEQRLTELGYI
jgi:hypothetical protein